ncbi:hypothetical protein KNP414_03486 [Paenibacillus mucilaginosus KNP414]|uniref:Uncharacterized protein n=1 Tax=Paenibacillus mucilaginosus (strain KNP414) TaxID=1036673 RepID=F8FB77_PAEMK|nr:hypothetical protein KNP414_03486 [Paenibacillus mucilaginosus KNP414]
MNGDYPGMLRLFWGILAFFSAAHPSAPRAAAAADSRPRMP